MSPDISWHMKNEKINIFIRYFKIHPQMWITVKNQIEGTHHKRVIIGTIEMSRISPTSPGEITRCNVYLLASKHA